MSEPINTPYTQEEMLPYVVMALGASYTQWKDWEKEKNQDKDLFYQLADEELTKQGLMQKVIAYPGTPEKARERAERHNPGWKVVEVRPSDEGEHPVLLIENPSLKPFTYEHNGVRYSRQIRRGAVMVDEEWLQEEDPDLWEGITYQSPWGDRVIMPVEVIPEILLARLTKYIYNGKPQQVLGAPTAVSE